MPRDLQFPRQINVRLSDELLAALDVLRGVLSRAAYIREMIAAKDRPK